MEPKIIVKNSSLTKKICTKCNTAQNISNFVSTKNWMFSDGYCPICNNCLKTYLINNNWEWSIIDKICQTLDIAFVPNKFEDFRKKHGIEAFPIYAKYVQSTKYEGLHWEDYFKQYKELEKNNLLNKELPGLKDVYYSELKDKWGNTYTEEQLVYLENLYNGLLNSQNIIDPLQVDRAQKLCKISLNIDEKIEKGLDFDKLIQSYDKIAKTADFTPKNSANNMELSSIGEVVAWEEKRGWLNKWYDDVNRDIVDEVIHSMQAFVQRLYINEPGLGDEITDRINQIKIAAELEKNSQNLEQKRFIEDPFFTTSDVVLDEHDNKAYEDLILDDSGDEK